MPETTAWPSSSAESTRLFPVGGHELPGLPFLRRENDPLAGAGELLEVVLLHVAELHHQHTRLRPLAVLAELHLADDGFIRGLAHVVGKLGVVQAPRRLHRLSED